MDPLPRPKVDHITISKFPDERSYHEQKERFHVHQHEYVSGMQ